MTKQAMNPVLPGWEYTPDVEPRVFDKRLYLYGSHDRFNGDFFCMNDYVCWSAPVEDLAAWRYEGVIYKKGQDPLDPEGKNRFFAPDITQGPDGRYYLYYTLNTGKIMSVAVCDSPAGKFEFYGHVRRPCGTVIGTKAGGLMQFDPGIFTDNDGRTYLYSGFAPPNMKTDMLADGCYVMELSADMLTIKHEPKLVLPGPDTPGFESFDGHRFFEASSMRKIGELYYLTYSSQLHHELCYAISTRPDKGFTFGGTIVSICDIGISEKPLNYSGNTHGGMVYVNGQWYIFYHRHTNFHERSRQVCAEPIFFDENGHIAQVEVTSQGINNKPLQCAGKYEARIACNLTYQGNVAHHGPTKSAAATTPYFTQDGQDREEDESGYSQYIANMHDGAMAGFKYFQFDGQPGKISVQVRGSAQGEMVISTEIGKADIGKIPICATEKWQVFSSELPSIHGKKALYFTYSGHGCLDFLCFDLS